MNFRISYILPIFPAAALSLLLSCSQAKLSDARGQYLRGEYHAAGETCRRLYRSTPRRERALRGIIAFEAGENYRRLNQSARAATAYGNAIRYGYPDTVMYLHYARMLHREGKYEAAKEAYRRFLTFRPDDPIALNGLRGADQAIIWNENPSGYTVQRAELFNSARSEFSPALTPEGDRLYFTSSREEALGEEKSPVTGMKYNDLFLSVRNEHGEWQKPERISSGINTDEDEGTPSISPSGEWMYYTFCHADPDRPATVKIYLSGRGGDGWSEGRPLEIVKNDSISVFAHPAISPSGHYLYFVSDMPGGYGGKDIWRAAIRNNEEILFVENPGPEINTAGDELFPSLCNDTTLYFSSDGHPGMGGLDLFVAEERGNRWQVSNLQSPLNSPADDFGITFAPGEEKGFFSSNRNNARGYDHIYSFARPEVSVWIEGFSADPEDDFIPGAIITVEGSDGSQLRLVTGKEGEYRFKAGSGVDYLLTAAADGFLNQRQTFSTAPTEKDTLYYVDFEMVPYMVPYNRPVLPENIFYDLDSDTLRPESIEKLEGLITLLNDNPTVTIKLTAHTDRKGSDEYNFALSQRRAQSVTDWLAARGTDRQRLSVRGFGKTRPARVTKKMAEQFGFLKEGDALTEEFIEKLAPDQQEIADQINRRTSFEVIRDKFGPH
ncbi:MAG: OmpA family protein [Proteiniphilum sp.]|nr:OmpA family protein [Proteiniphilum sp.]